MLTRFVWLELYFLQVLVVSHGLIQKALRDLQSHFVALGVKNSWEGIRESFVFAVDHKLLIFQGPHEVGLDVGSILQLDFLNGQRFFRHTPGAILFGHRS